MHLNSLPRACNCNWPNFRLDAWSEVATDVVGTTSVSAGTLIDIGQTVLPL